MFAVSSQNIEVDTDICVDDLQNVSQKLKQKTNPLLFTRNLFSLRFYVKPNKKSIEIEKLIHENGGIAVSFGFHFNAINIDFKDKCISQHNIDTDYPGFQPVTLSYKFIYDSILNGKIMDRNKYLVESSDYSIDFKLTTFIEKYITINNKMELISHILQMYKKDGDGVIENLFENLRGCFSNINGGNVNQLKNLFLEATKCESFNEITFTDQERNFLKKVEELITSPKKPEKKQIEKNMLTKIVTAYKVENEFTNEYGKRKIQTSTPLTRKINSDNFKDFDITPIQSPKKKSQNFYTKEEDMLILNYIKKHRVHHLLGGNLVWKTMAEDLNIKRSWESLRSRYRTYILRNLNKYITNYDAALYHLRNCHLKESEKNAILKKIKKV